MFESPVGRRHQAAIRTNRNLNGNQPPLNRLLFVSTQDVFGPMTIRSGNRPLRTDQNFTNAQEIQLQEDISTVTPPRSQAQHQQELIQDSLSPFESIEHKPVSRLIRNAENKFVPQERLMEVENGNIRPSRIMENNSRNQVPNSQTRSLSSNVLRNNYQNQINQSKQSSSINLFNHQKSPKENDQNINNIQKGIRIDLSGFNLNLNVTNRINLISQVNQNQGNNLRHQMVTPPVLECAQNNQQNVSQLIFNQPKENPPVSGSLQFSHPQSPQSNKKAQPLKNQYFSKKNRRKDKVRQKKNAEMATLNAFNNDRLLDWFNIFEAPFHQSKFPYLTPEQREYIEKICPINTKSQQFQKLIRTPNQLLSYKMIQYLEVLNEFKKSFVTSNQSHDEELMRKMNPQNLEWQQMKLEPFDLLKLQYGPINMEKRNYQLDQKLLHPNPKILQKQIKLLDEGEGSLKKYLEQAEMLRIQKQQYQSRHPQYNQNKYYQRVNPKQNWRCKNNSSQNKFRSHSTNDRTTTSKGSHLSRKKKFQDQLPKVSEFNISPFDKPYDKKYVLKIDNYEVGKFKWFLMKLKHGLKNQYRGEVKFQRYPSQIKVNDVIIRDIFQRQEKLFEFFKDRRSTVRQYGLREWFSPMFDLQLEGVLILPLQLKLPQGYDYFYTYYYGTRIHSLVIFNKFAQVSFIDDVFIKERCEKERDLRDKIRFDNDGIWIGCQMLKRKCKFTFWGTEEKLEQFMNPDLSEDNLSKKILPLNKDGQTNEVYYDMVHPSRLYGQISWKEQKVGKKSKTFNFLLILFPFLILLMAIA